MHGNTRSNGKREEEEESEADEDFKLEDLQDTPKSSSWKNMHPFKSFRNYYSRRYSFSGRGQHSNGCIIHPENQWYVVWTHFILIWAVYSSFFTPLEFAFFRGLPENLFLLDIAGQFTFLVDIVISFFVGYRDPHSHCVVYNPNSIARRFSQSIPFFPFSPNIALAGNSDDVSRCSSCRYLKSRFIVDLLGCFPWDVIYKACGRKEVARYMLWIRLSRAMRVTEFFEKLEKDTRINYLFTRIIKLFVVELYCTHTAACIFYYLATTLPPSKEGYTWIGSLKMGDYSYTNFRDIDLWTRYVTALYFAVVTMATVGYGEIHAVNSREMIFVMMYVSFDMILGAYLLGNMTALIVKGSRTERFRDKMAELIKYVNRNNLGKNISKAIKGHIRLQFESSYTDTAALQDLPLALRLKISNKLYEPDIRKVPLFKDCSNEFITKVAIRVHEEYFLPGEVIVEEGSIGDQLYILCDGKLNEVRHTKEDQLKGSLPDAQIYSSIGDISVLCNIPEPHTVVATELSKLLRIDKQALIEIIEIYFSDGRTVINNMLEGRENNLRKKILESDITLHIEKHELELGMRLNCAADNGDMHRLRHLVEAGADPNKMDYNGQSPLHRAASKGHEDIVQYLIQEKVDINIKDNFGQTPLFEAIKNGHDGVATLLIKAGASLSIDNTGYRLCEAVVRKDSEYLKRLLANGVNPNSKNYDLRTPLHLAASEGLYTESVLLLEAGASVLATDRWGRTPLDEARIGGNRALIKLLEDEKITHMSECLYSQGRIQDMLPRRKCTVFPGCPWDQGEERSMGVVLWVPDTIEELITMANEQLGFPDGSCVLLENGCRIVDASMVLEDQKLFLVSDELVKRYKYKH